MSCSRKWVPHRSCAGVLKAALLLVATRSSKQALCRPTRQHDSCKTFPLCVWCGLSANRWRDHARLLKIELLPCWLCVFLFRLLITLSSRCHVIFLRCPCVRPKPQRPVMPQLPRLLFCFVLYFSPATSISGHADNTGIAAKFSSRQVFGCSAPRYGGSPALHTGGSRTVVIDVGGACFVKRAIMNSQSDRYRRHATAWCESAAATMKAAIRDDLVASRVSEFRCTT